MPYARTSFRRRTRRSYRPRMSAALLRKIRRKARTVSKRRGRTIKRRGIMRSGRNGAKSSAFLALGKNRRLAGFRRYRIPKELWTMRHSFLSNWTTQLSGSETPSGAFPEFIIRPYDFSDTFEDVDNAGAAAGMPLGWMRYIQNSEQQWGQYQVTDFIITADFTIVSNVFTPEQQTAGICYGYFDRSAKSDARAGDAPGTDSYVTSLSICTPLGLNHREIKHLKKAHIYREEGSSGVGKNTAQLKWRVKTSEFLGGPQFRGADTPLKNPLMWADMPADTANITGLHRMGHRAYDEAITGNNQITPNIEQALAAYVSYFHVGVAPTQTNSTAGPTNTDLSFTTVPGTPNVLVNVTVERDATFRVNAHDWQAHLSAQADAPPTVHPLLNDIAILEN